MSNIYVSPQVQQQNQHQSIQQLLSPSQIVLFSRLNNHLLFHFIPLVQFWESSRLCVTIGQFQKMLAKIKFNKGKDQIQELKQQGLEFISLDKLLLGVNQWKRHDHDIATFLQKQKLHNIEKQQSNKKGSQKKIPSSLNKSKIKQQKLNKYLQIQGDLQNKNTDQVHSSKLINSRITKGSNYSISQHYLNQQQKKNQEALNKLNQTLIRTKNQSNYELTIKIGELNDICKKLKNDLSYVISTEEDNGSVQIIQKSSKSGQFKVISQKVFEKKYEQLKTLNNNMLQEIEGTLQKDLRQTLVEVMFLSDQLEKQIGLLKRKGINN